MPLHITNNAGAWLVFLSECSLFSQPWFIHLTPALHYRQFFYTTPLLFFQLFCFLLQQTQIYAGRLDSGVMSSLVPHLLWLCRTSTGFSESCQENSKQMNAMTSDLTPLTLGSLWRQSTSVTHCELTRFHSITALSAELNIQREQVDSHAGTNITWYPTPSP